MNRPYFHPDDSGMLSHDQWRRQQENERNRRENNHGGNRGGGGPGLLSPFLPGDKALLAEQLSAGFGGAPKGYMRQFNQMYQPMQPHFNPGRGGLGALGGVPGGVMQGAPVQYGKPYETFSFADPETEAMFRGRR